VTKLVTDAAYAVRPPVPPTMAVPIETVPEAVIALAVSGPPTETPAAVTMPAVVRPLVPRMMRTALTTPVDVSDCTLRVPPVDR